MSEHLYLSDLNPGQSARILKLHSTGDIRRRLQDLGLTEQTVVRCIGKSPCGDPAAYLIRGAVIAIRLADGKKIQITF